VHGELKGVGAVLSHGLVGAEGGLPPELGWGSHGVRRELLCSVDNR
jgi:hypothetical protein